MESLQTLQKMRDDSQQFGSSIKAAAYQKQQETLAKGTNYLRTIDDWLTMWYPRLGDEAYLAGAYGALQKDAPILSSTTAMYVADHGFNAFEQFINATTLSGLLGKEPYTYGGYRALTAAGKTTASGQAENATLPDSTKPTAINVNVPIKEVAETYDISARQMFLSGTEYNNVWNQPGGDGQAAQREFHGREFVKNLNRAFLTDNDTLASNNPESIDRVIGSNSEISGVGQDAGDLDIYGQDRDGGATVFDAYVNHASGVDRALTSDLILTTLSNVAKNWDGVNFRGDGNYSGTQNKFWLTGPDTAMEIAKIYENSNRYENNGVAVRVTMNGVYQYPHGSQAGMLVNTLYGLPLFQDDDTPQDTISRMYLIDGDHMKLKMGIPIINEEAGFSTGQSILLDRLGDRGLYYTSLELWADRFIGHGKIRDLL